MNQQLSDNAIQLLRQLISTPSFSREEDKTATLIEQFLSAHGIPTQREGNNVWAQTPPVPGKPTLLLNSHHDTVKPNSGYTRDPFAATIEAGKLFGLGSNDAGGALVSLLATFVHFYPTGLKGWNLVLAASAEEETSGQNGIEKLWPKLPAIDCAIVGEPTLLGMAVAEKGLMVLDCIAQGKAGHAAREEGVNAIYAALPDIEWFRHYEFPKVSPTLGRIKMSVTVIHAGQAHNQVPPECQFTVDVRATDAYSLEEILETVQQNVQCKVTPRSMRLRPSGIAADHPLVVAGTRLGLHQYGSPTTSDQALIPVPSVKMGPGDSARSHAADEFIYVDEIRSGIDTYIRLLEAL
ncbi:MAG: M20 family metallo-hydrolase [Cyclobacteriaceae bacterium]|nr:M20 family metallo-hydrolase [Cyclobacteriaceae bacterium]